MARKEREGLEKLWQSWAVKGDDSSVDPSASGNTERGRAFSGGDAASPVDDPTLFKVADSGMGQSVATAMESSVDHPFVSDVDSSVDPTSEADPFMYLTVGAGPSAAYADERGDGSSVDSPSTPTDARAPLVNFAEKQDEQELAVEGRGAELDDVPASAHTLPVDQGQRSPFSAPRVASSAGEASQTLVFQSPKVTGDADQFVSHSPETMTSEKGFFASDTRSFQSQSLEASTEDNSFARDTQQHLSLIHI